MASSTATLQRITNLVSPGGLLLFAVWALQHDQSSREAALDYAFHFCFASLAAAALLSWYHDYAQVLCTAVATGLAVWCFGRVSPPGDVTLAAAGFLLPLNYALFAALKERGVVTLDGGLKLVIIGAQVFGVWALADGPFKTSAFFWWGQQPDSWTWLPRTAALSFLVTAAFLMVLVARRKTNMEAGLLWALAAMFAGMSQWTTKGALHFYAGAAGLTLLFGVLEHGYDIAYRDELTGLPGRRAFNEVLLKLRSNYTIAMCDVDHFKDFNDTYGHDVGDQVLKNVASSLSLIPGGGRAYRYGGEEFALIFKGRSAKNVKPYVEAVRRSIAEMSVALRGSHSDAKSVHITISIGVADCSSERVTPEAVLEAADTALYSAKESGRNCVQVVEAPEARKAEAHSGR